MCHHSSPGTGGLSLYAHGLLGRNRNGWKQALDVGETPTNVPVYFFFIFSTEHSIRHIIRAQRLSGAPKCQPPPMDVSIIEFRFLFFAHQCLLPHSPSGHHASAPQ
jgi:hypothetical protein